MVELQMAVTGMCDAIAMLLAASGEDRTPKDRRDTADLCRKHVLTSANGIARKLEAGEQMPWTMRARAKCTSRAGCKPVRAG